MFLPDGKVYLYLVYIIPLIYAIYYGVEIYDGMVYSIYIVRSLKRAVFIYKCLYININIRVQMVRSVYYSTYHLPTSNNLTFLYLWMSMSKFPFQ